MATKAELEAKLEEQEELVDEITEILDDDDWKAVAKVRRIRELVEEDQDDDENDDEDEDEDED